LEDLLLDRDPHTRTSVLSALETLADPKATAAIASLLETELDGRVRRRAKQALTRLGRRGAPGQEEVRGKTQALEDELARLKVRLSKLEQGHKPVEGKATKKRPKKAAAKAASRSRKK